MAILNWFRFGLRMSIFSLLIVVFIILKLKLNIYSTIINLITIFIVTILSCYLLYKYNLSKINQLFLNILLVVLIFGVPFSFLIELGYQDILTKFIYSFVISLSIALVFTIVQYFYFQKEKKAERSGIKVSTSQLLLGTKKGKMYEKGEHSAAIQIVVVNVIIYSWSIFNFIVLLYLNKLYYLQIFLHITSSILCIYFLYKYVKKQRKFVKKDQNKEQV